LIGGEGVGVYHEAGDRSWRLLHKAASCEGGGAMSNLGKLKPRWSSGEVRYAGRTSDQSPNKRGEER